MNEIRQPSHRAEAPSQTCEYNDVGASTLPSAKPRASGALLRAAAAALALCAIATFYAVRHWLVTPPDVPAPAVQTVAVTHPILRKITETLRFPGRLQAVDMVDIRSRVGGHLTAIGFRDGDLVRKGQILFAIDKRPFEIELVRAETERVAANSELVIASRDVGRGVRLRSTDDIPASIQDQRIRAMNDAQNALSAADTAIASAKLDIDYANIRAPLDGRIGEHRLSLGNLVTGGVSGEATVLTTIVSIDPIRFAADIGERDLLALRQAGLDHRGEPVSIDLGDDTPLRSGKIDFIDNQVDRGSGTIRIRAILANTDGALRPGQFGDLTLAVRRPYDALSVPDGAILSDQSLRHLLVVGQDGIVADRIVTLGPEQDGHTVVRSGLAASDVLVVQGLSRVRPGMKVRTVAAAD